MIVIQFYEMRNEEEGPYPVEPEEHFEVVEDAIHFLIDKYDVRGLDGWVKI